MGRLALRRPWPAPAGPRGARAGRRFVGLAARTGRPYRARFGRRRAPGAACSRARPPRCPGQRRGHVRARRPAVPAHRRLAPRPGRRGDRRQRRPGPSCTPAPRSAGARAGFPGARPPLASTPAISRARRDATRRSALASPRCVSGSRRAPTATFAIGVRRDLVDPGAARRSSVAEVRDAIALLDSAFAPLTPAEELEVAGPPSSAGATGPRSGWVRTSLRRGLGDDRGPVRLRHRARPGSAATPTPPFSSIWSARRASSPPPQRTSAPARWCVTAS